MQRKRRPHRRDVIGVFFSTAALLGLSLTRSHAEDNRIGDDPDSCQPPAVMMISASWCGYCRKARRFFQDNDIAFEEIDAEQTSDDGVKAVYKRFGVPYIMVGGDHVEGFDEPRLRQLLCLPQ